MIIYVITKQFRALDSWCEDEPYFFTSKTLCEKRLKHLQEEYSKDYRRENSCFCGYSITEKNITFIEDEMFLEIFQQKEDFDKYEIIHYQPD